MWGDSYSNYLGFGVGVATFKGKINVANYNQNGVMDIVPGGKYNTIKVFQDQIAKQLDEWYITKSSIEWKDVMTYHSFIPSVSALSFKNTNFNWSTRFDDRNLVCNDEIPFDNYFTAAYNEEHVHVSEAAANWIMEEIDKGQAGCPSICNTMLEIFGTHCLNSNFTIAVNGPLPTGVTLAWEYNTLVLQKISQTTTSATFKVIGTILSSEVKVTLQNPCGANKVFIKELSLGIPEVSHTIIDASVIDGTKRIIVSPSSNTPYAYSWSGNGYSYYTNTPSYLSDSYIPIQGQYMWLKIEHPCKATQIIKFNLGIAIPPGPYSAKIPISLEVNPNPSSDWWNVSVSHSGILFYSLTDIYGKIIESGNQNNLYWRIDNRHLAAGIYFLQLKNSEIEKTIKLIKE